MDGNIQANALLPDTDFWVVEEYTHLTIPTESTY